MAAQRDVVPIGAALLILTLAAIVLILGLARGR